VKQQASKASPKATPNVQIVSVADASAERIGGRRRLVAATTGVNVLTRVSYPVANREAATDLASILETTGGSWLEGEYGTGAQVSGVTVEGDTPRCDAATIASSLH